MANYLHQYATDKRIMTTPSCFSVAVLSQSCTEQLNKVLADQIECSITNKSTARLLCEDVRWNRFAPLVIVRYEELEKIDHHILSTKCLL